MKILWIFVGIITKLDWYRIGDVFGAAKISNIFGCLKLLIIFGDER